MKINRTVEIKLIILFIICGFQVIGQNKTKEKPTHKEKVIALLKKYESALQALGNKTINKKERISAVDNFKEHLHASAFYYDDLGNNNSSDTSYIKAPLYLMNASKNFPLGFETRLNFKKIEVSDIKADHQRNIWACKANIQKLIIIPKIDSIKKDSLIITTSKIDSTKTDSIKVEYCKIDTTIEKRLVSLSFYIKAKLMFGDYEEYKIYAISKFGKTPRLAKLGKLSKWWVGLNMEWQNAIREQIEMDEIPKVHHLKWAKAIKNLSLINTNITSLEPIKDFSRLEVLRCQGSKISSLKELKDLKKLKILDISNTKIDTLSGIENLIELEEFYCSDNEVTDVSLMKSLKKLIKINLSGNNIEDFSPLQGAMMMERINLTANKCTEIEFLSGKPELTTIKIAKNKIKSLDPLSGVKKLVHLDCYNNPIPSLAPISKSIMISTLNVGYTKIKTLDHVKHLRNITHLNVEGNTLNDFSALSNFIYLHTLALSKTSISDLSGIMKHEYLEKLWITHTDIPVAEKNRFKKKHPKCKLWYY